jgi:hypothetical protein
MPATGSGTDSPVPDAAGLEMEGGELLGEWSAFLLLGNSSACFGRRSQLRAHAYGAVRR